MSAPVSVVVPTIGRDSLRECLQSIAGCNPPASEILVVDQGGEDATAAIAAKYGAKVVPDSGLGVGRARNKGIAAAQHEVILVTDDDCTVDQDWVGVAHTLSGRHPMALLTGRVLPCGDPMAVPSTIDRPDPRDFSGELSCGALYPNNMVGPRSQILELGGFDNRVLNAEDNDFCYRWLRCGLPMRYEPGLVVHHHDWRSHAELESLYVRYARGQGRLYAKHLRRGDLTMLRFLARDVRSGVGAFAEAAVFGRPRWSDPRRGIPRGLIPGLLEGWSTFAPPGTRPERG